MEGGKEGKGGNERRTEGMVKSRTCWNKWPRNTVSQRQFPSGMDVHKRKIQKRRTIQTGVRQTTEEETWSEEDRDVHFMLITYYDPSPGGFSSTDYSSVNLHVSSLPLGDINFCFFPPTPHVSPIPSEHLCLTVTIPPQSPRLSHAPVLNIDRLRLSFLLLLGCCLLLHFPVFSPPTCGFVIWFRVMSVSGPLVFTSSGALSSRHVTVTDTLVVCGEDSW